jgi:group I intron endonuclease
MCISNNKTPMKKGIVYRAKNKLTGEEYIGSSFKILEARREKHYVNLYKINKENVGCCRKFYQAIKDYGWDNFDWKVIEKYNCLTTTEKEQTQELHKREGWYQRKYDTVNNGLNCYYAHATNEQRREKDNQSRQKRRDERKMYCKLCDQHYNYDAHKEHIDSKRHQVNMGNKKYKCIGRQKEYDSERYQREKELWPLPCSNLPAVWGGLSHGSREDEAAEIFFDPF